MIYFDKATRGLAFDLMISVLKDNHAGDTVSFHGDCHNPTSVDTSNDQWQQISDVVHDNGLMPVLDFAYQGFAEVIREDAEDPLRLMQPGKETLICGSFPRTLHSITNALAA